MTARDYSPADATEVVHVAVGVVKDARGRLLIARRADHLHQGGRWEFPGGKVERGERLEDALQRELHEELGIDVLRARPLLDLHYTYPEKTVCLDVWLVEAFAGEARGREGQQIRWITPDALREYRFPDANRPIVNSLLLPARYLITGQFTDADDLLRRLRSALERGIRLVQFRAPHLDDETYARCAEQVLAECARRGVSCLLNRDVELVEALGADGVHLNAKRLEQLTSRPLGQDKWVAVSAHNRRELRQAERIGADFAVIGAVEATASHPGRPPLGWQTFAELVRHAGCPCYALGGVGEAQLPRALESGAQGIAAIRAWWPPGQG